ncbi:kinase [Clostridium rectalis]|uniref:GHMP family kinase ATP-binding protein n=1 Tax=Clostridium rectalis TaxID=2040295 RepID=UPI000F6448BD|nr:kinase [Clostridium rectalis]
METVTYYPGSFGEILQGNLNGIDILCSCPINIFTKVKIIESKKPIYKFNNLKSVKFLNNLLIEWGLESYNKNLDILIQSNIPKGKGFASSTADLCGVYYGLLKLFNKNFKEDELIRNCIKIEPSDSIIFKELNIFDYKKGIYKEKIGNYMEFNILVFEGKRTVDTLEFNRKSLPPLQNVEDLIEKFKKAIKENNVKEVAYCSEESIKRNQNRLNYNILSILNSIKKDIGGYGIIGAHSGDALGIIYEDYIDRRIIEKYSMYLNDYRIYNVKTLSNIYNNMKFK